MTRQKTSTRLTEELLEITDGMRRTGLMSEAEHDKITLRLTGKLPPPKPVTPTQIRTMRERAKMSQTVFAHHLNVTPGYVSQLERGTKRPTGAALALLNVIKRKGIEAIL
jgi:putative transcriptional regulator